MGLRIKYGNHIIQCPGAELENLDGGLKRKHKCENKGRRGRQVSRAWLQN